MVSTFLDARANLLPFLSPSILDEKGKSTNVVHYIILHTSLRGREGKIVATVSFLSFDKTFFRLLFFWRRKLQRFFFTFLL
jgi:hypothetical protein